jgi:hypothetical protein
MRTGTGIALYHTANNLLRFDADFYPVILVVFELAFILQNPQNSRYQD